MGSYHLADQSFTNNRVGLKSYLLGLPYNVKLTGRAELDLRRSVKFAEQMPRCKLPVMNVWLGICLAFYPQRFFWGRYFLYNGGADFEGSDS